MKRKKHFQPLLVLALILITFAGCGNKAEQEPDNISVDNFYGDMEQELSLEPMVMQEPEKTFEIYYLYTNEAHEIKFRYERSNGGTISIDGYEIDIQGFDIFDGGTAPEIGFYDINRDGTADVVIRRLQFRGYSDMIFLSENGGYRELVSVASQECAARYRDYEAEYLDGFRIRVRCEEFGVDAVLSLREEAVDWHKQVGWIYDETGKLVHGEKAADGLYAAAEQALEYFIKDGELYVCLRSQFVEGNTWSGVCMSLIYKATVEGFEPVGMYLDEVDMQGW